MLIIDRYHPRRRQRVQAALATGSLVLRDELALLDPTQLRPLALLSLWLLLAGFLIFGGLACVIYIGVQHQSLSPSFGQILLFCLLNIVAYLLVLPLHEVIHALVILLWGGHPHFGVKFMDNTRIPLALYCGARQQLFPRNAYLTIALAPLVVISLGGIILTWLSPPLAFALVLATAGNLSGAAGDILMAWRLAHFLSSTFVEDTETGYRTWSLPV